MKIGDYTYNNPEFFWLLLLIPVLAFYYFYFRKSQYPVQKLASLEAFKNAGISWRHVLHWALPVFRLAALTFIIIALARPQTAMEREEIKTKGIDMVLSLDISSSMLARDFDPDRLGAAKRVAKNFIDSRDGDRIGMVVFAGESFTQCPVTTDYGVLKNLIDETETGMVEDGTAIGMGLATAVDRLKESPSESKVVILLTDGVNNTGSIDPETAAEMAQRFGVKVYTIGVGSKGRAPYPVRTPRGKRFQQKEVKIDEELLKQIADQTGGRYYRATDEQSLENIYSEIDQLEKTEIEVSAYKKYSEKFLSFALWGGLFFGLELFGRYGLLKRVP